MKPPSQRNTRSFRQLGSFFLSENSWTVSNRCSSDLLCSPNRAQFGPHWRPKLGSYLKLINFKYVASRCGPVWFGSVKSRQQVTDAHSRRRWMFPFTVLWLLHCCYYKSNTSVINIWLYAASVVLIAHWESRNCGGAWPLNKDICASLSLKVCPDQEPGLQPWMPGHSQEHRVTIGYGKKVLLTTSATVHSIEILNGGTIHLSWKNQNVAEVIFLKDSDVQ